MEQIEADFARKDMEAQFSQNFKVATNHNLIGSA
jgi:hypothetical protein